MLEQLFSHARIYQGFQRAVGGTRARIWTIERYVHVQPGDAVLDLGCGPGDLIPWLMSKAQVRYVGLDISQRYLDRAQRYESSNVSFFLGDCTAFPSQLMQDRFDWVICMGLLHHLTDAQCDALLRQAAAVLSPRGTVICLEPTFRREQGRLTQAVMKRDRGRYVRWTREWERLYTSHFNTVEIEVLKGAFRIPYEKTVGVLKDPRTK